MFWVLPRQTCLSKKQATQPVEVRVTIIKCSYPGYSLFFLSSLPSTNEYSCPYQHCYVVALNSDAQNRVLLGVYRSGGFDHFRSCYNSGVLFHSSLYASGPSQTAYTGGKDIG